MTCRRLNLIDQTFSVAMSLEMSLPIPPRDEHLPDRTLAHVDQVGLELQRQRLLFQAFIDKTDQEHVLVPIRLNPLLADFHGTTFGGCSGAAGREPGGGTVWLRLPLELFLVEECHDDVSAGLDLAFLVVDHCAVTP
jgi:hypothetical protein